MKYEEKTKNATSDEERLTFLYTLLEGAPEKAYNRQLETKDKLKALKNVWLNLEDSFGYRNQCPLVDITKRRGCSPVDGMPKGYRNLLDDLCHFRD